MTNLTSSPIRVMLVDDHTMVRRGLATFLKVYDDLQLVGEAENGEAAVQLCAKFSPDVILMDMVMPLMDGIAATRIIRQQFRIMLEVRAAAAGVGDDGVELLRWELVNVPACEFLRQRPFAVVRVQRTAAALFRRCDDFTAVLCEHFHGVSVHVAEGQVLRAAGQHGDAVTLLAEGRRDGRDEFGGKLVANVRCHRFQFPQTLWEQPQHAATADELLQSESLIEPENFSEQFQPAQIHEQPAHGEAADEIPFR